MASLTFQVLEGVDRGRVFRDLETPVTIGREEGNLLRLNDERVSRFHAKVQQDNDDIILTDLESTNGTKVNGQVVPIRRLRPGDRICVGRSLLLFGSNDQIAARLAALAGMARRTPEIGLNDVLAGDMPATIQAQGDVSQYEAELDFDLNINDHFTVAAGALFSNNRPLPPLPVKLTPAQAARLSEILDFLHRGITRATENIEANEDGTQVTLNYAEWQKVLALQMVLALYVRAVTEPDALTQ